MQKIKRSRKLAVAKESLLRIFFRPHATASRVRRSGVPRLGSRRAPSSTDNIIRRRGQRATRIHQAIDPLSDHSNQLSRPNIFISSVSTASLLSSTSHHACTSHNGPQHLCVTPTDTQLGRHTTQSSSMSPTNKSLATFPYCHSVPELVVQLCSFPPFPAT